MTTREPYFVKRLKEAFDEKQRRNKSYSIRSLARDLGLHSAVVSDVLKNKRILPVEHAQKVAKKLNLSPAENAAFVESIFEKRKIGLKKLRSLLGPASEPEQVLKEELHHKVIAEWEYYAVLSLTQTHDFESSSQWIAKRLGITESRADIVLTGLEEAELISKTKSGEIYRTAKTLSTTEDVSSTALKKAHTEALQIGASKLISVPIQERYFGTATLTVSKKQLNEARLHIKETFNRLAKQLKTQPGDEVYQLCIQFYPLTQEIEIKEKK